MTHMQAPLWSAIGASGVERVRVSSRPSPVCRICLICGMEAECGPRKDSFFGRALLPENELEHVFVHISVTTIRQKCSQRSSVQWTFAKVRDNSHARNPLVGHRCDCCWLMVGLSGLRLLGLCGLMHALPTLRVG